MNLLREALRFSVSLSLFYSLVFRFCAKKLRFLGFGVSLRFTDFPLISIWFSVFAKILTGFRI